MNFRQLIRKIRFVINTYRLYLHDACLYIRYSNGFHTNVTQKRLLDYLIVFYHPIEKGLAMPNFRLGFGKDRLLSVINLINEYESKWGDNDNKIINDAISVIKEYDSIHKQIKYKLDSKLQAAIDNIILKHTNVYPSHQPDYSRDSFFSFSKSDFKEFAKSRRSVRNYLEDEHIDKKIIFNAIELSITAPSTCNRQSVKVHVIENKELVKDVLSLQSGNRGFGHLADYVLILTSDLQSWNVPGERFSPYIDSGIFAMNLLYSLHYYRIGACPLNWSENTARNEKLHKLLNIPDNEIITMMISCGRTPEYFKVVRSERKSLDDIMVKH